MVSGQWCGGVARTSISMRERKSLGTAGVEAEEVFDLGGGDEEGDAVGEADDDGAGDVLDGGAEAGKSHDKKENAGHDAGARARPDMPNLATIPATMTTKAPVGPPIWVRDPPRAEMMKPAITAV
jgi:hypothetical protein